MAMLGRKKIKKRPGTNNAYFTDTTQDSIKKFQLQEVGKDRNIIFEREILPALKKMAEYWVYAYGIESPIQSKDELVQGCVGFLHDSIHKWDSLRATKAFSYFNVIARNWLINVVNNHKKHRHRDISINDIDVQTLIHSKDVDEKLITQSPEHDMLDVEFVYQLKGRVKKIRENLNDESDFLVMDAIETVFDSAQQLDFMNRTALFVYIRELCRLDKRTISKSMSKIRKQYYIVKKEEETYVV